MGERGRVIVGVDGSQTSPGVLRRAVREARQRDAPLLPVIAWTASDAVDPRPQVEFELAARRRLDTVFELAFDGLPQGVRIHPLVLRGEPGRVLVATADRLSDLLVVGSGHHAMQPHDARGPVTRYCWAHADCELLIVPPSVLPERLGPIGSGVPARAGAGYLD